MFSQRSLMKTENRVEMEKVGERRATRQGKTDIHVPFMANAESLCHLIQT